MLFGRLFCFNFIFLQILFFAVCGNNIIGDCMKKFIRILNGAAALAVAVIFAFVAYADIVYPDEMYVKNDSVGVIDNIFYLTSDADVSVGSQSAQFVGSVQKQLSVLGVIPIKNETVKTVAEDTVLVSGDSFGIKLYADGVMVVGTKDVEADGKSVNPAKSAGIEIGDIIVSINGEKVFTSDKVQEILNDNNGEPYSIKLKRSGSVVNVVLMPVFVQSEGKYKAGIWVRDSTAGIGTITFFNPSSGKVAALGHPITDVDTGEIIPILNGQAVETTVTSVTKSSAKETGSICCDFSNKTIGTLKDNTANGIYGEYSEKFDLSKCSEYSVALPQEVQKGFCQIITTVDENGPQVYSAEISKIYYTDGEKNMIIKITDEHLLAKTGGIVQGMSGTPIIQNGKLIGAITHVIVDNPQKGYAVFAQTMLDSSK